MDARAIDDLNGLADLDVGRHLEAFQMGRRGSDAVFCLGLDCECPATVDHALEKDSAVLMSSPVLGLISSWDNSRETQIKVGQVYQRLSLIAASFGIWCQPMSQIVQVEETKKEVAKLQPEPHLFAQIPFRLGFAEPEKHRTPRRSLAEVLVE